jgi:hypothetical protein
MKPPKHDHNSSLQFSFDHSYSLSKSGYWELNTPSLASKILSFFTSRPWQPSDMEFALCAQLGAIEIRDISRIENKPDHVIAKIIKEIHHPKI